MKNLKRLVSIILIASMIFTSNAMITLAENENQVVSSEETTATVGANARGALDSRATASDAEDTAEENIEVDDDFIGPRLIEPEEDEISTANENTDTENADVTTIAENTDADDDNVAASTEAGTSETTTAETETTVAANTETAAETETTVNATETTVGASESSVGVNAETVGANEEIVGANARGALVDDIATASDAEEDDNVKTDEEIKIASASTAEIKTNDEETFGAGTVYYAVAGTNPYSLYFSSSDLSTSTTISNIVSSGTIATYTYSNDRPWYSYRTSINKVEVLDDIAPTSMAYWFCECTNLSTIDGIDKINTSEVVSMKYLFFNCEALQNVGLQNFNTSNVTDMQAMFRGCKLLNSLDVSSFDTSNVTNMQAMFGTCQNITNLNLSNFNTSNVTDMSYMFDACIALTSLDLSSFNTSNVTNMCCMFSGLTSITNLDVSSFDTSNVTQMNTMFNSCKNITNLNLTNFNTSNVTTIEFMFYQCIALTSLDLSSFNTSNVTTMANMFDGCRALTSLDLSSFDTSNVTNMERTFAVCNELTIIVVDSSKFITTQVTNSNSMFALCNKLIGYQGTVYDSSHLDATYARLDDADNGNPGYFSEFPRILIYDGTTKIASASYLMSDIGNTVAEPVKPTRAGDTCVGWYKEQALTNAFNFASDTLPGNMRLYVKWGKAYTLPSGWKGTLTTLGRDFDNDIINITFEKHPTAAPTTSVSHATIPSSNGLELYIVANGTKYDAIIYAPEDGVIFAPVNSEMLFNTYHVNFLEKINNLSYLDTSRVTNMSYMFHSDKLTELDLSNFNTSNVTTMTSMFATCKSLTTLDLSSFDTSNVTNMSYMFSICEKLENLNISSFDTSNVTTMEYMFSHCALTSLDLSSFNTSSLTNALGMFNECSKLASVNLSNFNTSNVTTMERMFFQCGALINLDLSNFDTNNVTTMTAMFGWCRNLNFIKVDSSRFNTSNVTTSNNMFAACLKLIGSEGTKYDDSHIDVSYAHIDAADSGNPGYFSEFPRIFVYDGTTRLARHDYTMANIGHTVAEPTKPTKTGLYFGGWYKEEALTNEFNFATDVLPGNMFLYVKWSTTPPTPTPTPTTKTIKSVDINRTPRRTTYTEGDYIDPTGIVLKVTYDDNTTETITYDRKTKNDFTFKPALDTPLTTDDKEVVITYGKKTVRFSIVVDKKSDPTPSTGGNGGNSGGGSDPTKGPMGDLTKNPEYAKLLDPLANPLPAQPIDQTLNTTNNLPQEDLIYDTKLIDALKSFPENANPTKANVEDTDGNKGYGEWLNVPRTTTWYFLTGNLKPEDVATMSAKESGGFLRSGWYNLGWKGENKWYHFNTGGVMDIGWYTENNLIYYLEADLKDGWYGKAVTGTKVIDGITYNFGTNGALIP